MKNRNTALLFFCVLTNAGTAQSLDGTFGSGGTAQYDIMGTERITALALQPDGRIVACGIGLSSGVWETMVLRFNPDGSLDPTFNGTGYQALLTGPSTSTTTAVAVSADGGILVAGYWNDTSYAQGFVRKFNADGSIDTDFGVSGLWTDDILPNGCVVNAMRVQPDGHIVIAGHVFGTTVMPGFLVARLTPDGSYDTTFNGTGMYVRNETAAYVQIAACDVDLQPDGKIVAGGMYMDLADGPDIQSDGLVLRFNTDGSLDPTFGDGGERLFGTTEENETVAELRVQTDGRIAMTWFGGVSGNEQLHFARLNADGSDETEQTILATELYGTSDRKLEMNMVIDAAGGYDLVGYTTYSGGTDGFIGRLRPSDAEPDWSFGTSAGVVLDPGDWTHLEGAVIQPDGKLLVAGATTNPDWIGVFNGSSCGAYMDLFLARFNMPGTVGLDAYSEAPAGLSMQPNPAHDLLRVTSEKEVITAYDLHDATGRRVRSEGVNARWFTLDRSGLQAGAYFLTVRFADGSATRKVALD